MKKKNPIKKTTKKRVVAPRKAVKTAPAKATSVKTVVKQKKKKLVTKAAKATPIKAVVEKTKTKTVTKAAKAPIVKSAVKKAKKKAVTKPAKATIIKTSAKTKAMPSPAPKEPLASKKVDGSTFAKTNKPVAPLRERPLSPHLSIYSPQITSVLSILHRGTGVALYIGAFVLAAFIICLGYGEKCFTTWVDFFQMPVGKIFLFGWIFCLYYHLCNGIRHLMWDIGKGFELANVTLSGLIVLFVSLTLTFTTFFITHLEILGQIAQ